LGEQAELLCRDIKADASYSKKQELLLETRLTPLLAKIPADASGFAPGSSIAPDPCRIGWGEIGRVIAVKSQEAVEAKNYDEAVKLTVLGTRFAFLVSSGDASDALVGLLLADSIRREIAPTLRAMSPKQLGALAEGIEGDLKLLASPAESADHERLAMLSSIEELQTAYQKNQLDTVEGELGQLSVEPLDELKSYAGHRETKRVTFMQSLDDAANVEASWLATAIALPPSKRDPDPLSLVKLTSKKPWNAVSRLLFMAGSPMMSVRDRTLARTNLLVLTCRIVEGVKGGGAVPKDLSGFSSDINHDPYTGGPMLYTPKGDRDFLIYSTGEDGIDNGGETDDAGLRPDLFLEGAT
jgi:hypothetical protein